MAELYDASELITGDAFLKFAEDSNYLVYSKRDFLFRSGKWRDSIAQSALNRIRYHGISNLVLGHSDISTNKSTLKLLNLLGVSFVAGANTVPVSGLSMSLPIGLTNFEHNSQLHELLSNQKSLLAANSEDFPEKSSVCKIYANFRIENNSQKRMPLLRLLSHLNDLYSIEIATPSYSNLGRIDYLRKCRSSDLVLCPEGNGIDTHRLWETLYMGGTPVVIRNKYMNSLFDKFPIVQLNSWTELQDRGAIDFAISELKSKKWDFEGLRLSYWRKIISLNSQERVNN